MKHTKALKWLDPYRKQLGYTIERANSGHLKIHDPQGTLIATISATPSDWRGHKNA